MLSLCLLGTLISCQDKSIFHQYCSTPPTGWSNTDTLHINTSELIASDIELEIELRHTPNYRYSKIFIACEENLTDSTKFKTDTIALTLINSEGRLKGEGLGRIYQTRYFYKRLKHPQISSKSEFRIYHLMNDSTLQGIEDIGIRINHASDEHDQHLNEGIQIVE